MENLGELLQKNGYYQAEMIFYYENRPFPFTEIWVNKQEQTAVLIDHGICEQPVCGATWSYRMYVEKQNKINLSDRWLRYSIESTGDLERELLELQRVARKTDWKQTVDPRQVHPQLIGENAYRQQLKAARRRALRGEFPEFIILL